MMRRTSASLGLALGLGVVMAATCSGPRPTQLTGDGVTVRRVARPERAVRPGGVVLATGDWVLEDERVRIVVGGLRRGVASRGAILEAALEEAPTEDGIVLLAPRVRIAGTLMRVTPTDIYAVDRSSRPALRIVGTAQRGERVFEVHRELTLMSSVDGVAEFTTVHAVDELALSDAAVVARLGWGGAAPFAEGVGPLEGTALASSSWVGRSGVAMATAFGLVGEHAELRAAYERHGETDFLAYTDISQVPREVEEGEALRAHSQLVLAEGGLSEAVRRIGWARGRAFPEVVVQVPYQPAGAVVRVRGQDGRVWIRGRPNVNGTVVLPLPLDATGPEAPALLYRARAWGHAPSAAVALRGVGRHVTLRIPEGGRVRVSVADPRGRRQIARVRFIGVDGSESPDLGPDGRADGAGDTVLTTHGDVTVPIAAGRYRVVVSRGPEWTLHEERVEVTETFRPHVRATLARVVDPGDWVAADLHVHAAPSPDSEVSLDDRVLSLLAEGVRFAVPTDHNHVADYAPSVRRLRVGDFGTIPGVEVTTWDPSFGHFNAFPWPLDPELPENGAPNYQQLTPAELFASLREVGGPELLIQVNHPHLEPDIGYFDVAGYDPVAGTAGESYSPDYDLLEVWNGFDLGRLPKVERVFSEWLAIIASGERVVGTGSSDSHAVRRQWAGYPRTYVRMPGGAVDEPREVLRALGRGAAFVTNGPFVEVAVGEAGPGQTATVTPGPVEVRVRLRAPPWIDISAFDVYVGTELAHGELLGPDDGVAVGEEPPPVLRVDRAVTVNVLEDSFIVVRVRGDRPMDDYFGRYQVYPLAFTNPVWVDADGDGYVPWTMPPPTPLGDGGLDGHVPVASDAARSDAAN